MKLAHRRHFLHLAAGAAALPAISRVARAQVYPARPVHVIVGFTAGTNIDIVARLIGQWLAERLGQPFINGELPRPLRIPHIGRTLPRRRPPLSRYAGRARK
jgi:hypothetical protein